MASAPDSLVERLLHELAVVGKTGLTAVQFEAVVRSFYDQQNADVTPEDEAYQDVDLLFSEAPPKIRTFVTEDLIETCFESISKRADVHLVTKTPSVLPGDLNQAAADSGRLTESTFAGSQLERTLAGRVLCASEERIWLELAGHGVDHSRIPAKEFECLQVIAASGPGGVLQKYVTERTGQDKRSVPKRTDRLAQNGYIVKEPVIGEGAKTSALTLTKFKEAPGKSSAVRNAASNLVGAKPVIFYDEWFDTTIRTLQENGNIVSFDELRNSLGITLGTPRENRRWLFCIRRITASGLVRGVTAEYERPVGPGSARTKTVRMKCVELLRAPTDDDRLLFQRGDPKSGRLPRLPDGDEEMLELDEEAISFTALPQQTAIEDPHRAKAVPENHIDDQTLGAVPMWDPTRLIHQQVFELVNSAGAKGMTSRELRSLLVGPLYPRPLDEVLAKLTDVWQFSQPQHLHHLTLIRDTVMCGKLPVYQYHSLSNFEDLVAGGKADWEAVQHVTGVESIQNGRSCAPALELDEWGFVRLASSQFEGDGRATLAQCRKVITRSNSAKGLTHRAPVNCEDISMVRAHGSESLTDQERPDGHAAAKAPVVAKHSVTQNDIDMYAAAAQGAAERKVLADLRKTLDRGGSARRQSTLADAQVLPQDLVARAKEDIIAHQKPGVYINTPEARATKKNNFIATGRPRNTLIAVFKFDWLKRFSWFEDNGPVLAGRAPRARTSRIVHLQEGGDDSEDEGVSDDAQRPPSAKRRRISTAAAVRSSPSMQLESRLSAVNAQDSTNSAPDHGYLQISGQSFLDTENSRRLKELVEKKSRGRPSHAYLKEVKALQLAVKKEQREGPRQTLVTEPKLPSDVASALPQDKHTKGGKTCAASPLDADIVVEHSRSQPLEPQSPRLRADASGADRDDVPASVDGHVDGLAEVHTIGQKEQGTIATSARSAAIADAHGGHSLDGAPSRISERAHSASSQNSDPVSYDVAFARLQQLRHTRGARSKATKEEIARLQEVIRQAQKPMATLIVPESSSNDLTAPAVASDLETETLTAPIEVSLEPDRSGVDTNGVAKDTVSSGANDASEDLAMTAARENEIVDGEIAVNQNQGSATPRSSTKALPKTEHLSAEAVTIQNAVAEMRKANLSRNKVGVRSAGGTVNHFRNKIILDAVRACNGIFPGNNEMWYVVATAWQKRYRQLPERTTVDRALRNLIASGKLKKMTWTFKNKKGFVQTRSIIAEPDIDPATPQVSELQRIIELTLPNSYLPRQVDVFEGLRHQAGNAYNARAVEIAGVLPTGAASPYRMRFPVDKKLVVQNSSLKVAGRKHGFADATAMDRSLLKVYRENIQRLNIQFSKEGENVEPDASENDEDDVSASSEDENTLLGLDDEIADEAQAAMQSTIQIRNYRHDFHSALPPRINPASRIARLLRFDHPQTRSRGFLNAFPGNSIYDALPVVPVRRRHAKASSKSNGASLGDGEDGWLQARMLLMGSGRSVHIATGTYATRGFVLRSSWREMRDLRIASSISKHHRPVKSLADALDMATKIRGVPLVESRNKNEAFYREVDALQEWEEIIVEAGLSLPGGVTFPLINHIMRGRHIQPSRGQRSYAPTTISHLSMVAETGKPREKRIYHSRKPRVDDGGGAFTRDKASVAAFKDSDRLLTAVALIATVCGGINQDRLNWTLIAHALSFRYDGEFLRRRWQTMAKSRATEMEQLRNAIRQPFLVAYENGELPRLDFQNLAQTDWPVVLKWVETKVTPRVASGTDLVLAPELRALEVDLPELPSTKAELDKIFAIEYRRPVFGMKHDVYHNNVTAEGRQHMLLRFANGTPLPGEVRPTETPEEHHMVLKSWIRAVALTKQWNYDVPKAGAKLAVYPEEILRNVTQQMVDTRVILQDKKGRHFPGRNFQIHSDVLHQFRRWPKQDEHMFLRMVANARTTINDHFQVADTLPLVPTAQDSEYLVLTNMVAQGFVRPSILIPERNDDPSAPPPRLTKWPYSLNGYETRNVDINDLKYPIVYEKTQLYQPDHGLTSVPIPRGPAIFAGENDLRIPIWMDIHGNLIEDVWDMVLRSIMHLLVYRPGSTTKAMEAAHNEKLWMWEVDLVVRWMEQVGIAEHAGHGSLEREHGYWRGGWRASEWWYCAFLPEIATWSQLRVSDSGPYGPLGGMQ